MNLQKNIPEVFIRKLANEGDLLQKLYNLCSSTQDFIGNMPHKEQPFFPDYTDHGYNHIIKVLQNASEIIPDDTYKELTAFEIFYLVSAIIIHDIGMHITPSTFRSLVNEDSNYDLVQENEILSDKRPWQDECYKSCVPWNTLFKDFVVELNNLSSEKKLAIYGDSTIEIPIPDLNVKGRINEVNRATIGEFIRKYHHRYCHEIALLGYNYGTNGIFQPIFTGNNLVRRDELKIIGIIARSHNHPLHDPLIVNYWNTKIGHIDSTTINDKKIRVKYLMSVLRISDFMEIGFDRSGLGLNSSIVSPLSMKEHTKHYITRVSKDYSNKKLDIIIDSSILAPPEREAINSEIKSSINEFQTEINDCYLAISHLNELLKDTKFELNIRQVVCNLFDIPSRDAIKQKEPFKYHGYAVENLYLKKALKNLEDDNYYYIYNEMDAYNIGITNLFQPPVLTRKKGDNAAMPRPAGSPNSITSQETPASITSIQPPKPSNITIPSVTHERTGSDENTNSLKDFFNPENDGIGIIAELGYGKTFLSQALFCYFGYKCLYNLNKLSFWPDLNNIDKLDYFPIFFKCDETCKIEFANADDFISESIKRMLLKITDNELSQLTKILTNYFNGSTAFKILFIIDAIDELDNNDDSPRIRNFLNFLRTEIVDNTNGHLLLYTKRKGNRGRFSSNTIQYTIQGLNYSQQKEIMKKLSRGEPDPQWFLDFLTPGNERGLSEDVKTIPFYLTSAFFFLKNNRNKHKFTPSVDDIQREIIKIFFYRKGFFDEAATKRIELVEKIAINMVSDTILESKLLELIEQSIFLYKIDGSPQEIMNELTQKIGILKKSNDNFGEESSFSFIELKYRHIINEQYESSKTSTISLVEELRVKGQAGRWEENDSRILLRKLKNNPNE